MTYIHSIGIARPQNRYPQEDLLSFMMSAIPKDKVREQRLLKMISHKSGIQERYSVLDNLYDFFDGETPTLEDRLEKFNKSAVPLAVEAVKNCIPEDQLKEITHLVTISCTGISAPGIDIDLIKALSLSSKTTRTTVNFMGCYAALHGLRIADQICHTNKNAKVLLVDVELCSLHYQNRYEEDHLMANTLFGDGAAALFISNSTTEKSLFKIDKFASRLAINAYDEMAWTVSRSGFQMRLSNYVPDIIEKDIQNLITDVIQEEEVDQEKLTWAFHPGGVRILQSIARAINVDKEEFNHSYEVLTENGNMSSVTILHVLDKLTNKNCKEKIFAAGFGPGLTMEAMLLTKISA
ncbi:type III polyketide synthase [Flammeovirga agarivorans]|uniref:Type III polyketide synthase n=1 Tax=Flammeovirga agarivorans TaxID=2726742 RepID=A0A7X8SNV4_9BACT|nr:type III polyketide synthase [Flammeovirga agarivorans]NLR93612.1 type III polyketide synthase [Flammeovirga agarivorans]